MARRTKPYLEGDKVGPYNLVLVKRFPKRQGIFRCKCGKEFKAAIPNVANGTTTSFLRV